jgi:pSer/pThr/pTyr-binding forkhead associated (FHA) protein/S1-C subfamily serine protease
VSITLRVLRGARAGQQECFAKPVISIGRHQSCDLRFDAEHDLDVSTRHAEIRDDDGAYVLRDTNSTNGTFVNGERVTTERALRDGDVVSFGALGPQVEVRDSSIEARHGGVEEPSLEPRVSMHESRSPRMERLFLAGTAVVLLAIGGAYWLGARSAAERERELGAMRGMNDSLTRALAGRVAGLDSALAAAQMESGRLERELARARGGGADTIAAQLSRNENRRSAMLAAAQVDYSSVAQRNARAVALIAVEWSDGRTFSGTGFCIDGAGRLITNRHVVADSTGRTPRRITVIFNGTRGWLAAHVVRVSASADLALLQLDAPGPFPAVPGVSDAPASPRVGSPIAIIGFPLGTDTPMEGSGSQLTASASLVAGTVSKHLANVLQIDAYAGEGSSGSPVFDLAGRVVGVVYGSNRESVGRIVYAVPAEKLSGL